jgi:hypothetical protein
MWDWGTRTGKNTWTEDLGNYLHLPPMAEQVANLIPMVPDISTTAENPYPECIGAW